MLTIFYERIGNAALISHTDMLRILQRTFRRAGISVSYSGGFVPHMQIFLSQPLPFGLASTADFVTADTVSDIDASDAVKLFNEFCPKFLRAKKAYVTAKNPNLSGKVVACGYFVKSPSIEKIEKPFFVKAKDGKTVDASDKILSFKAVEGGFTVVLAFGEKNLRIDTFLNALNERHGLNLTAADACRVAQYANNLINIEDFLVSL